jgi:hypothetical protein
VHVARLEGRILLEEFLTRVPGYRPDMSSAEMPPSEFQIGYTALPVSTG